MCRQCVSRREEGLATGRDDAVISSSNTYDI